MWMNIALFEHRIVNFIAVQSQGVWSVGLGLLWSLHSATLFFKTWLRRIPWNPGPRMIPILRQHLLVRHDAISNDQQQASFSASHLGHHFRPCGIQGCCQEGRNDPNAHCVARHIMHYLSAGPSCKSENMLEHIEHLWASIYHRVTESDTTPQTMRCRGKPIMYMASFPVRNRPASNESHLPFGLMTLAGMCEAKIRWTKMIHTASKTLRHVREAWKWQCPCGCKRHLPQWLGGVGHNHIRVLSQQQGDRLQASWHGWLDSTLRIENHHMLKLW